MHGLILKKFEEYIHDTDYTPQWTAIAQAADVAERQYETDVSYPDEEVMRVIDTTARLMGTSSRTLVIHYGIYVSYSWIDIYAPLFSDDWGALEIMMETEERFHPTLRDRSQSTPPLLEFRRTGPHEVTLTYRSTRKLCALAIGVGQGMARACGETLDVTEERCMHDGAESCLIRFRRRPDNAEHPDRSQKNTAFSTDRPPQNTKWLGEDVVP